MQLIWRLRSWASSVQVMPCRRIGDKPIPEPMCYCRLNPCNILRCSEIKRGGCHSRYCVWKCGLYCSGLDVSNNDIRCQFNSQSLSNTVQDFDITNSSPPVHINGSVNRVSIGSGNGRCQVIICWMMLECCYFDPQNQTSMKYWSAFTNFHSRKCSWNVVWKCVGYFVSVSMCNYMVKSRRWNSFLITGPLWRESPVNN